MVRVNIRVMVTEKIRGRIQTRLGLQTELVLRLGTELGYF